MAVQVIITDRETEIVKQYWQRGFQYFAFDVSHLGKRPLHQTAVAYRFQSTFAYYPLAIGAIGGTGHGLIDLVVITSGTINLRGAFEQGKEEAPFVVKGKTAVNFTPDEIREIAPQLAGVFRADGPKSFRVRNFLIEVDNIGKFKNDFIAVPAAHPAPAQDDSNTPDEEDEMDAPGEVHILVVSALTCQHKS